MENFQQRSSFNSKKQISPLGEIQSRFQQEVQRLEELPVNQQRKLQRRWKKSLTGIALSLALSSSTFGSLPVRAAAVIMVNSNADVVADDGLCTLREAINNAYFDSTSYGTSGECIAGSGADTIGFDPTVFNTPQTISLVSGELHIMDDLTITGPGEDLLTINANENSRVFSIYDSDFYSAKTVKISDLTITGGKITTDSGGGILTTETLELNHVSITNNTASMGGGIFANLPENGSLTIKNSILSGNDASSTGGGLFVYAVASNSEILIDEVVISDNQSPQSGGIFINGNHADITLTGVTLTGNAGSDDFGGGTIDAWNSTTIIANTTVRENTLTGDKSQLNISGLFVQTSSGNTTITDSTISNNTTTNTAAIPSLVGGGLALFSNNANVTLKNSIIDGNSVDCTNPGYGVGGGIVLQTGNHSNISIENTQITNNTSTNQGGGLYVQTYDSSVTVENSVISGNHSGHLGGGIMVRNESLSFFTLKKSSLTENIAGEDGGGIAAHNRNASSTKLFNSTISGNTSQANGGGIFFSTAQESLLEIAHSTITNNTTAYYGGGIAGLNDAAVELKMSILAANTGGFGYADSYIDNYLGSTFDIYYTLIGDSSGNLTEAPVGSPDANGNLIGGPVNGIINPQLGSLAENKHPKGDGSYSFTHALLPNSPALDAVPADMCLFDVDQRGVPRPQGDACDMGAYEYAPFFIFMPLTLR